MTVSQRPPERLGDDVLGFLEKDYELKIRFLSDHYSRTWTRFNFFMVATTALALGMFQALRSSPPGSAAPYALAGAILALFWYIFGAQDRYLVEAYRSEIKRAGALLAEGLDLPRTLGRLRGEHASASYIAVGDVTNADVPMALYQWRSERFSTTKLPAWFPLVMLAGWLAVLVGAAR
jgi:hypothetical protein